MKKADKKILNLLAEFIGVDSDDLNPDDSFTEDLHMSVVDISDFTEILSEKGYDISPDEMIELNTVSEVADHIGEGEL